MRYSCNKGHIGLTYNSEPCPLCASHKRMDELKAEVAELRAFDAEVDEMVEVCPECGSWDTEEIHYAEDFGSRKCISCGFSGGPGEDFETYYMVNARSRRVGKELAAKDATNERLRGLLREAEDLLRYWVKRSASGQWEKTDVARKKTLDYFDKQARAGEEGP